MPAPDGPQFNPTHDWQNAGGVEWEDTGAPDGFRPGTEIFHQGEGYAYLVKHSPSSSAYPDTDWVTSIFDDTGQYSTVSGHSATLADAQLNALAYHDNEWRPGSDHDLSRADDLGDLVDPQNDTYVEEGTHGGPLLAAALPVAAALGRKVLGAAAVSGGMKAGANIADKLTGGGGSTDY